MRRKPNGNGWAVFLVLTVLLVAAIYFSNGFDNLLSVFVGGGEQPEITEEGVFMLAKDQASPGTRTPEPTPTRFDVEVTTLPDNDPLFMTASPSPDISADSMPTTSPKAASSQIDSGAYLNTFADFIAERARTRDQEIAMLTELETNVDSQIASEASAKKLDLIRCMEAEITLRGLMLAKGYKDAVATVQQGSVNIAVVKPGLTDSDIATLLDLASRETGEAPGNIKIIPVSEE